MLQAHTPGESLRLRGDTPEAQQNRDAVIKANQLLGEARKYMNRARQIGRTDEPNTGHSLRYGRPKAGHLFRDDKPSQHELYQKLINGFGRMAADQFLNVKRAPHHINDAQSPIQR